MNLTTTTVTMSSLELVAFINTLRGEDEAKLQHRDFVRKVPKVIGKGVCENFRTPHLNPQNGQTYMIYNFPKREACLMAMSYSYELQAKVFDRMTELEAKQIQAPPATLTMANVSDALRLSEASRLKLAKSALGIVDPPKSPRLAPPTPEPIDYSLVQKPEGDTPEGYITWENYVTKPGWDFWGNLDIANMVVPAWTAHGDRQVYALCGEGHYYGKHVPARHGATAIVWRRDKIVELIQRVRWIHKTQP